MIIIIISVVVDDDNYYWVLRPYISSLLQSAMSVITYPDRYYKMGQSRTEQGLKGLQALAKNSA